MKSGVVVDDNKGPGPRAGWRQALKPSSEKVLLKVGMLEDSCCG